MNDKKNKDGITDTLKKVISVGVGAAFMTEEAVKKALGDLPIPKDMVSGLMDNAKNVKAEFLSSIQEEVKARLAKVDPQTLLEETLKNFDVEVNAKVSFKPKKKTQKKN